MHEANTYMLCYLPLQTKTRVNECLTQVLTIEQLNKLIKFNEGEELAKGRYSGRLSKKQSGATTPVETHAILKMFGAQGRPPTVVEAAHEDVSQVSELCTPGVIGSEK